jgi:MYXO-CTERM domain-containing protein
MMVKRWCLMVLAGAAVLGAAGMAEACTCEWCSEAVLDTASYIPANTPGFPLAVLGNGEVPSWHLIDIDRSVNYSVGVVELSSLPDNFAFLGKQSGYLIQPEQPLEPGSYILHSPDSLCSAFSRYYPTSNYKITEEAPLPQELGTLMLEDQLIENVEVKEYCGEKVAFDAISIFADVKLTQEARPWRDALFFTTLVDGERLQKNFNHNCEDHSLGEDSGGRGYVQLFSLCGQHDAGLAPGRHTVQILAWLPGTDTVLETEEVEFELDCTELEAQLAAANPGDGAPDEGEATSADEEDAGCNVSPPSGVTSGGWLGLGLAGLGVWVGLRRR